MNVKITPLIVDLDGTLLRSDLLLETGLLYLRNHPLRLDLPIRWLLEGKQCLKSKLAQHTELDITNLPFNQEVLKFIKDAKTKGRKVILATASHQLLVDKIADYLGIFDEVFATDDKVNLSGLKKAELLVQQFGAKNFDYIGNSKGDLEVWKVANKAISVNKSSSLIRKAKSENINLEFLSDTNLISPIMAYTKAFRLHQWLKNLLIFLPFLASHRIFEGILLWKGLVGFLAFGLCASSVYILNDLLDLDNDRKHYTKRKRPFASGRLSIIWGMAAFPILLFISFLISYLFLPYKFFIVLCGYYTLTLAYSLRLKQYMIIDVVSLALLYTVRVFAGSALFTIPLSFWLLAFCVFLFLSLAFVKRHTELLRKFKTGKNEQIAGRGYTTDDLPMISSLGTSAGYITVLILALYINDKQIIQLYSHPKWIWFSCIIMLTWISRIWLLAHRGKIDDDPVIFAITDKFSLFIVILMAFIFWIAI